jgi:hypothetical protein
MKETRMPRKKAAEFKCEKCGKAFSMAMHLGRHMTTTHGEKPKTTKPARAKKPGKARRKGKRVGRPSGVIARLGLKSMSLDQLIEVIAAAKAEASARLTDMMEAVR